MMKQSKGITLIALVITIIILLILAGISISQLTGSGLFERAREAEGKSKNAQAEENAILDSYEQWMENYLGNKTPDDEKVLVADGSWNSSKNVNSPKLMGEMKGVYWTESGQKVYVTAENQDNWYNYTTDKKQWANAETKDGSLWVWIPRYEYYLDRTNQTIDVKFIPTTAKSGATGYTTNSETGIVTETINGKNYIIHPAFMNDTANQYKNGGWDEELAGFWVAKFPAGYAGGGNSVTVVDSGEKYSGTYDNVTNYYGAITSGTTTMKYPVFMGQTYAYNYINIGDSYKLAKSLTKTGNPYGLSSTQTDSHQMKNSEWGAVAYLTHSQYGLNGQNILNINNVNLNETVSTIYAVTGYAGEGTDAVENKFTTAPTSLGESISDGTNTSYAWYTANGQKGSSTQNITGVYDLSGGVYERTSGYIGNVDGETSRVNYGGNLVSETELKYKTIYPHDSSRDTSANNYEAYKATNRCGDAILETSTAGDGSTGWNGDYSNFSYANRSFVIRGAYFVHGVTAGVFAFGNSEGICAYNGTFRPVLLAQ